MIRIKHIKGFNGRLPGALQAHPSVQGLFYYVAGSSVIAVFEGDPTKQVQLRGHDDEVTAFAMCPSGSLLATGQKGKNSDVIIWDTQQLSQKFRFQEHDIEVCALGFSADNKLLASVGNERERRVFVLDTATGKIVSNTTLLEPKRTKALAWSPVSTPCYTFATAADMDIYIYVLDAFKGMISCDKVTTGSVRRGISCLQFSADGAWLFAGTASGDVLTVNVARRAVQLLHPVASAGVGAIMLSTDGKVLVGALDGTLSLFNFQQASHGGPPMAKVPGSVTALTIADQGASLLVGTQQGDLCRVTAGSGAVSRVMQSQLGAIKDLVWSQDASGCLATASTDGTVCIWNSSTLGLDCRVARHIEAAALSVAVSPELLLSGWSDGFIHCHARSGAQPGTPLWCIPNAHVTAHSCGVPALQLSSRGHFVASGGAGGELRVWDLASREMVAHMKHHTMAITDLKVLADDAHLISASEDRSWCLWDMNQEKMLQVFKANMGAVRGVALAPDQVSVVSVGLDRGVFVWDLRSPSPVRVIPDAHQHEATCCAVNGKGNLIATGGADCTVKLWDVATGRSVGVFAGHTATVNRCCFSPDDSQLASCSNDGTIVFWTFET
eukprot:gene8043-8238_t